MNENEQRRTIKLSSKQLTIAQLAVCLNVLAKQYHTTLPSIIRKLDRVSGDIKHLQSLLKGNNLYEWTEEQDKLLQTNEGLLIRWKGKQVVELRKEYLAWKGKQKNN